MRIESIYERWTPIPDAKGDRRGAEFLNEVKRVVTEAVAAVKKQMTQSHYRKRPPYCRHDSRVMVGGLS